MNIIKRSGAIEKLTKKKIFDSITKANGCVGDNCRLTIRQIQRITDSVVTACEEFEEPIPIDKIEDMIEKKLMEASGYEVAKAYITYRYEKEKARNQKTLADKLFAKDVVNQNANIDEHSFTGRIGEAASAITKQFAMDNLISEKAKQNHNNNEIYIHDLDHYAIGDHNCLSIPFDHLLKNGFNTRQVDIRPAQSVNTAFQLVAVIFQLQSLQQFGGVSATHLDWTMVPYVRKSFAKHFVDGCQFIASEPVGKVDERRAYLKEHELSVEDPYYTGVSHVYEYAVQKTLEELNQAVEGMYHNLNSLQSRSGGQVPFTSINYGTCTLPEGQWVIEALLNGSIKGLGKFHRTSIFPCGIFQLAKGINRKEGDPNYYLFRLALESTAKRLYPNYVSTNWSTDVAGNEIDRLEKQKYLDSLSKSDMQKLVEWAEKNPQKAAMFGFVVVDE